MVVLSPLLSFFAIFVVLDCVLVIIILLWQFLFPSFCRVLFLACFFVSLLTLSVGSFVVCLTVCLFYILFLSLVLMLNMDRFFVISIFFDYRCLLASFNHDCLQLLSMFNVCPGIIKPMFCFAYITVVFVGFPGFLLACLAWFCFVELCGLLFLMI